jgi:hypothetical protein
MFNILYRDNNKKWQDFLGYSTTKKDAEMLIDTAKELDVKNDVRNREYKLEVLNLTKELK